MKNDNAQKALEIKAYEKAKEDYYFEGLTPISAFTLGFFDGIKYALTEQNEMRRMFGAALNMVGTDEVSYEEWKKVMNYAAAQGLK